MVTAGSEPKKSSLLSTDQSCSVRTLVVVVVVILIEGLVHRCLQSYSKCERRRISSVTVLSEPTKMSAPDGDATMGEAKQPEEQYEEIREQVRFFFTYSY